MQTEEYLKKLRESLRKLKKKKLISRSERKMIMKMQSLIGYYKGVPLNIVSKCFDICEKSLKRWINQFESDGVDGLEDKQRSGRPQELPKKYAEELKKIIETQKNRIWVARHILNLIYVLYLNPAI